jgi:hypothetical protein
MHKVFARLALTASALSVVGLGAVGASAAASAGTYSGQPGWTLTAPQTDSYNAQVQQPINADGSSVFNHKSSTIPVQFQVTDTQSFKFESLLSGYCSPQPCYLPAPGPAGDAAASSASYTPPAGTTVSQITSLTADYTWQNNIAADHGGGLRWSITTADGNSIFVTYGDYPDFTTETAGVNGSGTNLLGLSDARVETGAYGSAGKFYDTWANASSASFLGNDLVTSISLVMDAGWAGDQVINLADANVGINSVTSTFTMPSAVTTATNSAPAYIYLHKTASVTTAPVDESTLTSTQGDSGGQFRAVDGKYIYNLPVNDLNTVSGDIWQVGVSFNADGSSPVPILAKFAIK